MTKEQQNLAWACLPKETRCWLRVKYKNSWNSAITDMLMTIYGKNNLSSNTEPEEILMVSRREVQDRFNTFNNPNWASSGIKSYGAQLVIDTLDLLFGDKCLTDKEGVDLNKLNQMLEEALENETPESLNEWLDSQESVQSDPKFEIGQKVILKLTGSIRKVSSRKYTPEGYKYLFEGFEYADSLFEEELEPYFEPKFHIGQKVRSKRSGIIYTIKDNTNKDGYGYRFVESPCPLDEYELEFYFNIGDKVIVKDTKQIGTIKEPYSNDNGYRVYFEDGDGGWDGEYTADNLEYYTESEIKEQQEFQERILCNTDRPTDEENYKDLTGEISLQKEEIMEKNKREDWSEVFEKYAKEGEDPMVIPSYLDSEALDKELNKPMLPGDLIEIKGKDGINLKGVITELVDSKYVKVQPIGLTCIIYVEREIVKQDNTELYGE